MNKINLNWKKITAVIVMAVIYIAVLIVCNNIDKKKWFPRMDVPLKRQ